MVQKKHLHVYAKFKNYLLNLPLPGAQNPPWVPPPPETRQTSIFLFFSLYTSMVTKNKFFSFPARLTPPPLAPVLFGTLIWKFFIASIYGGMVYKFLELNRITVITSATVGKLVIRSVFRQQDADISMTLN